MTQIRTYAKLNLYLYVSSSKKTHLKTPLHEIYSLFQIIDLYDTLTIQKYTHNEHQITTDHPRLPTDEQNTVLRVLHHYSQEIKDPLHIHIQKNIPIGGGLGGSSTNVAGILQYINTHYLKKEPNQLRKESLQFGSDIPFFLYQTPSAIISGIGENCTPVTPQTQTYYLLIIPPLEMMTAKIYTLFDQHHPKRLIPTNNYEVGHNDLKSAVWSQSEHYQALEDTLQRHNAPPLYLSGSGATVFCPIHTFEEGEKWESFLKETYPSYRVCRVKTGSNSMETKKQEDHEDL